MTGLAAAGAGVLACALTAGFVTALVPSDPAPASRASQALRGPAAAQGSGGAPPSFGPYLAPLGSRLEVVRPYDPPNSPYGAGHRGVDLRARPGATVTAAAAGRVEFAGPVGGRGVVVLGHPDGVRTEYEPVRPLVRAGAHVRAGEPIGVLVGRHAGCPDDCLHWGARRGADYLDPLRLLDRLGPVVLLPNTTGAGSSTDA